VDEVKAGTILIGEGTVLPESIQFASESYSELWRTATDLDGYELDRKLRNAGWNFFFLAGEVKGSALGSDVQETARMAIARLSARLPSHQFNCLQLTRVALKHFLGFPYVTVSAHWRHIQNSMFLFQPDGGPKLLIKTTLCAASYYGS
jgi:hypothetical protein